MSFWTGKTVTKRFRLAWNPKIRRNLVESGVRFICTTVRHPRVSRILENNLPWRENFKLKFNKEASRVDRDATAVKMLFRSNSGHHNWYLTFKSKTSSHWTVGLNHIMYIRIVGRSQNKCSLGETSTEKGLVSQQNLLKYFLTKF